MTEKKQKKKKNFALLLSLLPMVLLGVVLGLSLGSFLETQDDLAFFIMLLCLLPIIYIHIILHEFGHYLAGLKSGYTFVSFRVGSLMLQKGADGKLHRKKMSLAGTGGQCLMSPPAGDPKDCPYLLYNLGGGLINIATGAVAMLLFHFVVPQTMVSYVLLEEFGLMGIAVGLANLVPIRASGIQNDGSNTVELSKNPDARENYVLLLRMNAALNTAQTFDDVPKDLKARILAKTFTDEELQSSSAANILNFQSAFFFADEQYEKARSLFQRLVDTDGVLGLFKSEARCELLFFAIMEGADDTVIKDLYNKEQQKYIKASSNGPSKQRLLYAYYHVYKKDEKKAEEAFKKIISTGKTWPIPAESAYELTLAEKIRNNAFSLEPAKFER